MKTLRSSLSPFLGMMALLVMSLVTSEATLIFNENFDNTPPYTNGSSIPTGFGMIHLGQWTTNSGTGSATVTTSTSLSASQSMQLSGDKVAGAYFGTNNAAGITTTNPLAVRFAFNLTSTAAADVYVRTADHTTVALIQFSGSSKYLRIQNTTNWNTSISIDLNTWYYAELSLPGDPGGTGSTYSMTVFESDGTTQRGATTSGLFTTTLTNQKSYRYVNFVGNTGASDLYLDNITVDAIPEPATVALLIAGGGLLLVVVAGRRRVSSTRS